MRLRNAYFAAPLAFALACGGNGARTSSTEGTVNALVTDAPTADWADIGVIIRSVALIPVGGQASDAVKVYDGSQSTTQLNLVQLDGLAQLLGSATIPAGTYDRAVVKVDGHPGDVTLVDASGNTIPTDQIKVKGARDSNGWVSLPIIKLGADLAVNAGQPTAVQLDFDLNHPLFIVEHDVQTAMGTTTYYVLNFVVRHKPHGGLDRLVLRQQEGQVTSVASDASSLVVHTLLGADLTLHVDDVNKTIFYDLDASKVAPNPSPTIPADLVANDHVRFTARFQTDGTLWAVRVWYSTSEDKLPQWSPEGHVVGVNAADSTLTVLDGQGHPVTIDVGTDTEFFFKGGTTAIGTGTSFLSNIDEGFKVQVLADPLADNLAKTIDIQAAVFGGAFQSASATSFEYYGDPPAGYDPSFSFWNFAYPGDASADQASFIAKATAKDLNPPVVAYGLSYLDWDSTSEAWDAVDAIFMPSRVSLSAQVVTAGYALASGGTIGTMTIGFISLVTDQEASLNVNLDTAAGSQPLVYEFTRGSDDVTVTPVPASDWPTALARGAQVRVFGVPDGHGSLDAYVVNIFD